MKVKTPGDHGSKSEQGSKIEDIRPDDDSGPDRPFIVSKSGDGSCDFGCISSKCGHHSEQCFRKAEALSDAFQSGNQYPAHGQTDDRS
jgi:hypothetical protein